MGNSRFLPRNGRETSYSCTRYRYSQGMAGKCSSAVPSLGRDQICNGIHGSVSWQVWNIKCGSQVMLPVNRVLEYVSQYFDGMHSARLSTPDPDPYPLHNLTVVTELWMLILFSTVTSC
eukprot:Gb_23436 [translate_table: standard]